MPSSPSTLQCSEGRGRAMAAKVLSNHPQLAEQFCVPIKLRIVVKSESSGGYCYIGYCLEGDCLLRPINNTSHTTWSSNVSIEVGKTYTFKAHPNQADDTNLPHCNEDILVMNSAEETESEGPANMFDLLDPFSKVSLNKIFAKENIMDGKYIEDGKDCVSLGILKTKKIYLSTYIHTSEDRPAQTRLVIKDQDDLDHDMAYTGLDGPVSLLASCKDFDDVLVIIGLGRPWQPKHDPTQKKMCYILGLGIIIMNSSV